MKSYTDLEQSKKLAKILPLESADMWWIYITAQGKHIAMMHEEPDPHYLTRMESYGIKDAAIPCWSLAALLELIPNWTMDKTDKINLTCNPYDHCESCYEDPVDAAFEMVCWLKENDKL